MNSYPTYKLLSNWTRSILCLFLPLTALAQPVTILPPIVNPFDCISVADLYNGTLINTSSNTYNGVIEGEIFYGNNLNSLRVIADGETSNFTIPIGSLTINNTNASSLLEPIKSNFYDNDLEQIYFNTNCLGPGFYEVCIRIIDFDEPIAPDGVPNVLGTLCYNFEIQTATPLLLVSPFDRTTIDIPMPLFTWTPVVPRVASSKYHIRIVELLGPQTPFEAFRANPLFFEDREVFSNVFQYPLASRPFDACRKYAWQVDYVTSSGGVLTSSEIWVFKTVCEEEDEEEDTPYMGEPIFYRLQTVLGGDFIAIEGKEIAFEISNRYQLKPDLDYYLIDEKGERVQPENGLSVYGSERKKARVQTGSNLFLLNLEEAGLNYEKRYTLVVDGLKRPYYLRFYIKESSK